MGWSRKTFLKTLGLGGVSGLLNINPEPYRVNNSLIKPQRLVPGDTIGLISPGSILPEPGLYDEIIQTISDLGFHVEVGANARKSYGNLAGTDAARADDLNQMFSNPDIDAVMPFRGGWGSNRILDLIDFDTIRKNPKALIGFSDITSLLISIYAKTGLVTFHGPVGKSVWNDFTFSSFKEILMSNRKAMLENKTDSGIDFSVITPGVAEGKLIGGNLTVLTSMLGSDYLPDWQGAILFVEDVGEEIYRIDRMLTQLKLNGILNKISGFIFGTCVNCEKGNKNSLSLEQVLKDHIQVLGVPSYYGSMIGHIDNMFTLPIGISAKMNSEKGSIKLLEVPTK
jgi:muramoyltetrapeptide carboxypeptidase